MVQITEQQRARFWARIDMANVSDCRMWKGAKTDFGYGELMINKKHWYAHRLAYELAKGPIPAGLVIRHVVCDNPSCVNPFHLDVGTNADNVADQVAKGRKAKGESHGKVKLTENQVREIRTLYAAGSLTYRDLGGMYGMDPSTIGYIVRGQLWSHVQ